MGERLDPEAVRAVMSRYFQTMQAAVERHGGTVEKFIGDAVMAVFGVPQVREDDALRAVRAAAEMQQRMTELNHLLSQSYQVTLSLRIGVNTGEVVAGDDSTRQALVTGDAVNTAARLEQSAQLGEVLLGPITYQLVAREVDADVLGPLVLKGKADPVLVYRLVGVRPGAARSVRGRTALVGRTAELTELRAALEAAKAQGTAQTVTILGEAGVGKSRLVSEFLRETEEPLTVLRGRCLSYGDGITYWPIVELARSAARIQETDDRTMVIRRIAELIGREGAEMVALRIAQAMGVAAGAAPAAEIAWAVRELLAAAARARPAIVVVDDIQWAEPTMLDLLRSFQGQIPAAVLTILVARDELIQRRPGWIVDVRLRPLSSDDARRMVESQMDTTSRQTANLANRLVQTADGNPFFVEELIAMLVSDGHLMQQGGRLVLGESIAELRLPETLGALLGARLDQLPDAPRAFLEAGAIEGEVFHQGAASLSVDEVARPGLVAQQLQERDFIVPTEATLADEAAYRFRHLLLRDAAYAGIPKRLRAELHHRLADWLEQRTGHRTAEYGEILGYHLEQAHRYRRELGRPDATTASIARRAARFLHQAGRRAVERDDPAAAGLLRRVIALLGEHEADRAQAELDLGVAPDVPMPQRLAVLESARQHAQARGDDRLALEARAEQLWFLSWSDPAGDEHRGWELEALVARLRGLDHQRGLARALRAVAENRMVAGSSAKAMVAINEALAAARAAGDEHLEELAVKRLVVYSAAGAPSAAEGLAVLTEVLSRSAAGPMLRSSTLGCAAVLHAMCGDVAAARADLDEQARINDALQTPSSGQWEGYALWLLGSLDEAEAVLRTGLAHLEQSGNMGLASTTAAFLAEVLLEQGRLDDAIEMAESAEAMTSAEDVSAVIPAWGVKSEVLAARGEIASAIELVGRGVAAAAVTDWVELQGEAFLHQARVLVVAGRVTDSEAAARQAVDRFHRKGNVAFAARGVDLQSQKR